MFFNIYIYIGILEKSREMFGLGGPSCPWMRSQNRFRTVGVDFCSWCRASNFLPQVIYGEWWRMVNMQKHISNFFWGCRQFRKLSRRLDKYNDRFSPSAVGKLFSDTSIPRLQLIWCYTCPWHVEGFLYGHHPTWVNHCNHFHSICIPLNNPSQILFPLL